MKATVLRMAPWTALGLVLAIAFGLAGAGLGIAILALAEVLQYLRDAAASRGANTVAAARRSDEAEAVAKRLTQIESDLKAALTPERVQMAKDILATQMHKTLARGLGLK